MGHARARAFLHACTLTGGQDKLTHKHPGAHASQPQRQPQTQPQLTFSSSSEGALSPSWASLPFLPAASSLDCLVCCPDRRRVCSWEARLLASPCEHKHNQLGQLDFAATGQQTMGHSHSHVPARPTIIRISAALHQALRV